MPGLVRRRGGAVVLGVFPDTSESVESTAYSTDTSLGGLAHLVERLPCKQEVAGSSPAASTPRQNRAHPRHSGPPTTRKGGAAP